MSTAIGPIRVETDIPPFRTFQEMPIGDELLAAIKGMGFTRPTPVQAYTIGIAMRGHDLVACARTGTGKTAAFAIPTVDWITRMPAAREKRPKGPSLPRALVLAPTRELAQQIQDQIETLTKDLDISTATLVGGKLMRAQTQQLRDGVRFVIATPGRLLDHMERGNVSLADLEIAILDEADRMFDMGFAPQIRRILRQAPDRDRRQTLMFSATMPRELTNLANEQLLDPHRIEVDPPNVAAENLRHDVLLLPQGDKVKATLELLGDHRKDSAGRIIIFTRTKMAADQLTESLRTHEIDCVVMHADRTQEQRDKALSKFKEGTANILVATDVASRGIDVQDIERVINYDFPQNLDDYIHRVGRTARAGAKGRATSIVGTPDLPLMLEVERSLGHPLPRLGEKMASASQRRMAVSLQSRRRRR